jgi:hypothetical protein
MRCDVTRNWPQRRRSIDQAAVAHRRRRLRKLAAALAAACVPRGPGDRERRARSAAWDLGRRACRRGAAWPWQSARRALVPTDGVHETTGALDCGTPRTIGR